MREDTSEVGVESLVDSEDALCADGFEEAVEWGGIERAGLVVHSGHDCVCFKVDFVNVGEGWGKRRKRRGRSKRRRIYTRRMHDDANHDPTRRTAGQM